MTEYLAGVRVRVAGTLLILAGGLSFLFLYLGFLAPRFPWYQNLAVVLTTSLVVPTAITLVWVLWGMSMGRRWIHSAPP